MPSGKLPEHEPASSSSSTQSKPAAIRDLPAADFVVPELGNNPRHAAPLVDNGDDDALPSWSEADFSDCDGLAVAGFEKTFTFSSQESQPDAEAGSDAAVEETRGPLPEALLVAIGFAWTRSLSP